MLFWQVVPPAVVPTQSVQVDAALDATWASVARRSARWRRGVHMPPPAPPPVDCVSCRLRLPFFPACIWHGGRKARVANVLRSPHCPDGLGTKAPAPLPRNEPRILQSREVSTGQLNQSSGARGSDWGGNFHKKNHVHSATREEKLPSKITQT